MTTAERTRRQRWHAARRRGLRLLRPAATTMRADALRVDEGGEHGAAVMLERALFENPQWGERAAEGPAGDGDARLRFASARMRIDGRWLEVEGYHRSRDHECPVTAEAIEIGIEITAGDSAAHTEWLPSDLALTAASARHPHSAWAIVAAGTSLGKEEPAELVMIANSGPPEAERTPDGWEQAEHWTTAHAIAACAIGGPGALPEAVAGLTARKLGQCLPVRRGEGVRIAVVASTEGSPAGSWAATGQWAEADDVAGAHSGRAAANRERYRGTPFEDQRVLGIGVPLDGPERVEALQVEAAGEPIEELGSDLRGRMRRPERGEASGTVVWRIDDGEDAAIAAHRISEDEAAAITDLLNANTIRTLAARAQEPRARRGLSAAIRATGLR